jgi:hypothetical protein
VQHEISKGRQGTGHMGPNGPRWRFCLDFYPPRTSKPLNFKWPVIKSGQLKPSMEILLCTVENRWVGQWVDRVSVGKAIHIIQRSENRVM